MFEVGAGDIKYTLKKVWDIGFLVDLEYYLFFPLVKDRVYRDVYNDILDRVRKALAYWKGNLLNKDGRGLVKYVTMTILVYTM